MVDGHTDDMMWRVVNHLFGVVCATRVVFISVGRQNHLGKGASLKRKRCLCVCVKSHF